METLVHALTITAIVLAVMTGLAIVILSFPYSAALPSTRTRNARVDERDTLLSRHYLSPEGEKEYYLNHPENREGDLLRKKLPGLLSEQSTQYHSLAYASADSVHQMIDALKLNNVGPVSPNRRGQDPDHLKEYIRSWASKMRAIDSGFCLLKPEHLYTIRGRHEYYGKPVETTHTHAIAFIVEMDQEFTDTAPKAPVIMESFSQYLQAGLLALQVAAFLRSQGWEAKAHIDSNYEVICPLVARDAGLGEIGRMGLLMSKKTGPRCRISVVTTTFPFPVDLAKADPNTLFFCEICKKCAENCPANAIPETPYSTESATTGWQIDGGKCFSYWCKAGTDCARCMAVCPFSHSDTFLHRVVRKGITNSALFAWAAFHLDNLFYGRNPKSKPIPKWMVGGMK